MKWYYCILLFTLLFEYSLLVESDTIVNNDPVNPNVEKNHFYQKVIENCSKDNIIKKCKDIVNPVNNLFKKLLHEDGTIKKNFRKAQNYKNKIKDEMVKISSNAVNSTIKFKDDITEKINCKGKWKSFKNSFSENMHKINNYTNNQYNKLKKYIDNKQLFSKISNWGFRGKKTETNQEAEEGKGDNVEKEETKKKKLGFSFSNNKDVEQAQNKDSEKVKDKTIFSDFFQSRNKNNDADANTDSNADVSTDASEDENTNTTSKGYWMFKKENPNDHETNREDVKHDDVKHYSIFNYFGNSSNSEHKTETTKIDTTNNDEEKKETEQKNKFILWWYNPQDKEEKQSDIETTSQENNKHWWNNIFPFNKHSKSETKEDNVNVEDQKQNIKESEEAKNANDLANENEKTKTEKEHEQLNEDQIKNDLEKAKIDTFKKYYGNKNSSYLKYFPLYNSEHKQEENIDCHPIIIFKVCLSKCFKTLYTEKNESFEINGLSASNYKYLEKCILKCKKLSFEYIHGGCIQNNGKVLNKKPNYIDYLKNLDTYNLKLDDHPSAFSDFTFQEKYMNDHSNNIIKEKNINLADLSKVELYTRNSQKINDSVIEKNHDLNNNASDGFVHFLNLFKNNNKPKDEKVSDEVNDGVAKENKHDSNNYNYLSTSFFLILLFITFFVYLSAFTNIISQFYATLKDKICFLIRKKPNSMYNSFKEPSIFFMLKNTTSNHLNNSHKNTYHTYNENSSEIA